MNVCQISAVLGDLPYPDKVGLPLSYFAKRGCFLDCRGPLVISESSVWGFEVRVYTQSHEIDEDGPSHVGPTSNYGVIVEDGAWIGSHSVLAGCRIGARSIVAAGTVVRGQMVAPEVMVAGNPARVIARWDGTRWQYVSDGYERRLG
jgi:maltose O-acetyltransferase